LHAAVDAFVGNPGGQVQYSPLGSFVDTQQHPTAAKMQVAPADMEMGAPTSDCEVRAG